MRMCLQGAPSIFKQNTIYTILYYTILNFAINCLSIGLSFAENDEQLLRFMSLIFISHWMHLLPLCNIIAGTRTYNKLSLACRGRTKPQDLIIAPNGVAYASPKARPGVLPRMLHEILTTRIMVKAAMKRSPASDKVTLSC